MHAYLSRDGVGPEQFRSLSRREVLRYPNVRFLPVEVQSARRAGTGFEVRLAGPRRVLARKLLIATGVYDLLPPVPGIEPLFGTSVFQCPYCDGWEMRGRRIAVYGKGRRGFEMALALTAWTRDLVLCTDGRARLTKMDRRHLERNGIPLIQKRIARLHGVRGRLRAVMFRDGASLACDALFFDTPSRGQSDLARSIGCSFTRHGGIACGEHEATSVPGVFVAGNIIRDVQLSIVAAAEGARAAFGLNRALTREDFERRATGVRRIEHPPVPSVSRPATRANAAPDADERRDVAKRRSARRRTRRD
jgi:thioredoxin reductase